MGKSCTPPDNLVDGLCEEGPHIPRPFLLQPHLESTCHISGRQVGIAHQSFIGLASRWLEPHIASEME
eukprot:11922344-Alexandrium_andersonii.AAC.2